MITPFGIKIISFSSSRPEVDLNLKAKEAVRKGHEIESKMLQHFLILTYWNFFSESALF